MIDAFNKSVRHYNFVFVLQRGNTALMEVFCSKLRIDFYIDELEVCLQCIAHVVTQYVTVCNIVLVLIILLL